MTILASAEFWVAAAFVGFMAILIYMGVPGKLLGGLDDRSKTIAKELDEARALREEAQKVLADYQRRRAEAEQEAKALVVAAQAEAKRLADEAKVKAEEFVARRTKMAESKIAQAETQAIAEVRSAAADAAVAAAEKILVTSVKGKVASELFQEGVASVKSSLN